MHVQNVAGVKLPVFAQLRSNAEGARLEGSVQRVHVGVSACVSGARVCVRVCACARACLCVCVRVYAWRV